MSIYTIRTDFTKKQIETLLHHVEGWMNIHEGKLDPHNDNDMALVNAMTNLGKELESTKRYHNW